RAPRLARQLAHPHQCLVHRPRALAAFADGPDDQRLAAAHVAAREDLLLRRGIAKRVGFDVAAIGELDARLVEHPSLLRAEETHRQQDQVGGQHELAAGDFLHLAVDPFDADAAEAGDLAVLPDHFLGQHRPVAHRAFLVARGGAQLHRPVGPGECLVFLFGRARHDLYLSDALGALAIRRADAVGAGVAAADHDHILASGDERAARRGAFLAVAGDALVLLGQELHRQANAGELGPRDLERARILGTARQHDGVEVLLERLHRHVDADFGGGAESNALSFHLHRAAVDQMLFHLEVGNSVTEQAADAVGLLEHGDGMAGASQLLRAGEAGRSRADDGDSLASLARRDLRLDPAFLPAAVDDRALD